MKVAIVTGASGINGSAVISHLLHSKKCTWNVIALARKECRDRQWWIHPRLKFVSVDLNVKDDVEKKLGKEKEVAKATHLFYAAYYPSEDEEEMVKRNLNMLQNIVYFLNSQAKLERINLVTGVKYYGVHKGPYKTPAEEDDPRHKGPNFYYNQEDFLAEFQKGKSWTYTVFRPNEIIGFSEGAMNLGLTIAVYATLCKETGQSLKFPGTYKSYRQLYDCSDVCLIAEMQEWAALSQPHDAKNTAFNCVNGDTFRWMYLWPKIGEYFGISIEEPMEGQPSFKLSESFTDCGDIWESIVEKYSLKAFQLSQITTWQFAEWSMSREYDSITSMNKAKHAGFFGWRDTTSVFFNLFYSLASNAIIPMYPTFHKVE